MSLLSPEPFLKAGWPGAIALGLLMALHPCFLSNTASAVVALAAQGPTGRGRVVRGALLVLGMAATHAALAMLLGSGLVALPVFASTLPSVLLPFLPPFFILAGTLMLGLWETERTPRILAWILRRFQTRRVGSVGAFLAGAFLALAFCPATAGLFFAVLLPVAIAHGQPMLWALGFSAGYGALLLLLTALLSLGVRLPGVGRYAWKAAGVAFIAWGLAQTLLGGR
ncbi:MAG: hypothetical protein J0L75_16080 [Spirochaetes bacterium]|nr:hypothetical protein [Spirochaetota bacterium]